MILITQSNFHEFYREHVQTVYRIAFGIVKNPEEAEDIVMECFTELINTASFNDENHIKAWLILAAQHRALNVAKSARMRRNVPFEQLPPAHDETDEQREELRALVLALPDMLKTPTYLFYYENMSAAEIAAALKITENTVYKRLQKARKLLKLQIEEEMS